MLSREAKAFQARRKTKPLTDDEIAALVDPPLPVDEKLARRFHKAVVNRHKARALYGRDEGKKRFDAEIEAIRTERADALGKAKNAH